jgi:hypothetical protein
MNWTGGSLQRTRNANKGIVQKQKAYFARARTHLQNGPRSPAAPFRPTYLQNDDNFELAGCLPSFGSGSVRHTGHSARRRNEATRQISVLNNHTLHSNGREEHGIRGTDAKPPETRYGDALTDRRQQKRKADDADVETQLLEANRKRLLGQGDWVGVTPSRPLDFQFLSRKDKSKVGRRRKVEGRHGAAPRQRNEAGFVTQRLQLANDQHAEAFMSGAIRNRSGDIRIRIGTDAWTTTCSTVLAHYDQSQASSEPMLFDQQTDIPEQEDVQEVIEPFTSGHPSVDLTSTVTTAANYEARAGERAEYRSPPRYHAQVNVVREDRDSSGATRVALFPEHAPGRSASEVLASVDTGSRLGITQQVEGVKYPLQFVFRNSSSSQDGDSSDTVYRNDHGDVSGAVYAGSARMGDMHLGKEPKHQYEREAAAAVAIVDDKPWTSYLGVSEHDSSHTKASQASGKSKVHQHHPTAQYHEAERTSWSQRATRGAQTHISSSVISASLPSVKRDVRMRTSAYEQGQSARCRSKTMLKIKDEDERLWQGFVFDNDEKSSSSDELGKGSNQRVLKPSSGYLPLSVAVSSVSPTHTPIRAVSRPGPHMSDSVHDTARFASHARFRAASSPAAMLAFHEELSDEDHDADAAERTAFGEHAVTHTSIPNNVPYDADFLSSWMLARTEMFRTGRDHPGHREHVMLDYTRTDSSETRRLRRSSVYDNLDSDEGIDLVDADREW